MTAPASVRLGPALAALLGQVSPANTSAALRALALIGAHAAGLDVGGAAREIGALLAADLAPEVRAALLRTLEPQSERVGQVYDRRPTPVIHTQEPEPEPLLTDLLLSDPFNIGIEV